jgi:hypothetical protein
MWCTSRFNIGTTFLYPLSINLLNYLPGVLHLTEFLLFADDTSICYSHNDPDELARVINEDLWMKVNKLSINTNKTNLIKPS